MKAKTPLLWLLAAIGLVGSGAGSIGVASSAGPSSVGLVTGHHTRSGDTLNFRWVCLTPRGDEKDLCFSLTVDNWAEMERNYEQRDHTETKKWEKRFVLDDPYRFHLSELAAKLNQEAQRCGVSVVEAALSFVQSIPHSTWSGQRYAIETLLDQTGDCSDKSMLLAGVLWSLNIDYIILKLPQHLAIGVWSVPAVGAYYWSQGRTYSYCETNWGLQPVGYCPPDFLNVGADLRHPAW